MGDETWPEADEALRARVRESLWSDDDDDDGLPWMTLGKARRGLARILGEATFTVRDDSRTGRVVVVVRDEVPAAKVQEAHGWLADRLPVHVAAVVRRESEGPYR